MKLLVCAVFTAAICLFGSVAPVHAQRMPKAVLLDEMQNVVSDGAKYVKVSGKPPGKDGPLYLHLQVEVITKRGNTVSGDGTWMSTQYTLDGLDEEALSVIADKAYAELSADLTAAGYKLFTQEEIRAAVAEVKFESKPSVQTIEGNAINAKIFTPKGIPATANSQAMYVDQLMGGGTGIGALDAVVGLAKVAGTISEAASLTPVYEKLGSPAHIRAVLILDFIEMKSKSESTSLFSSLSATSTLRMSINNQSVVSFSSKGSSQNGAITFTAPLASESNFIKEIKDESSIGKNLLVNLPTLLARGTAPRKITEKVAIADGIRYAEVAEKTVSQTRKILLPFLLGN